MFDQGETFLHVILLLLIKVVHLVLLHYNKESGKCNSFFKDQEQSRANAKPWLLGLLDLLFSLYRKIATI